MPARKGAKAEQKIASSLRRAGASVELSPNSRTSADLEAKWPSKDWLVQVKSSLKGKAPSLSQQGRAALLARARRNNATPVLATVEKGKIGYESLRSGRKLKPKK